MPTGNGCRAGGPRDASGSHTSRSGCGWRSVSAAGTTLTSAPESTRKRAPEQMSLTQRSGRWLAGNHSGCCVGGDGIGESEEVGVG
ncbi:hypothetical protein E2C01_078824 [Portunus trituberculatus]|uniref:Uncharacterized protein n=1 Tax=Portunus trituberculatus TaxID=210409 RepID=A0A5B7ITU6_PORTR|nr:hypothetical protein [Portunus trituberculatus]